MMLKPLVMDFPPIFMQASILTLSAIYHEYLYALGLRGRSNDPEHAPEGLRVKQCVKRNDQ